MINLFPGPLFSLRALFVFFFLMSPAITFGQETVNIPPTIKMNYELFKLKNGLQVLLQADPNVTDVSVEFWLKTGIRDEKRDKYGLAHFFEHVTPYGLRGKNDELKMLGSYRTGSNAQVRKDYTRYFTQVKPAGLVLALQYSFERIDSKSADIDPEKLENERVRVVNEINRNSVNPFWSAEGGMLFNTATFGQAHPYGHNGYGSIENNEKFALEDVRDWHEKNLYPENVILFVVGNFNKEGARKYIRDNFEKLKSKDPILEKSEIQKPDQTAENYSLETRSKDNVISFSWAVPGWGTKEDGCLKIIARVLDERLNANKPKEVIKASATGLLDSFQYAGQFGVYASFSDIKDREEIEQFLKGEVEKLLAAGISSVEIDKAKRSEIQTLEEMKKNLGFQYSRTELLGEGLLFKNDPNFYLVRVKQQIKLTKTEIEAIARLWLGRNPSKILFTATTN